MEAFGNLLTPGEPMLPAKTFMIELPENADILSVEVVPEGEFEINGEFQIRSAPLTLPMVERQALIDEAKSIYKKNKSIFEIDSFFPEKPAWMVGEGSYRNVRFVRVIFVPFAFNPIQKKLKYFPRAQIIVNYRKSTTSAPTLAKEIPNKQGGKILSFEKLRRQFASKKYPLPDGSSANYVIITTAALENTLASFVNWKQSLGYSVAIVSIEWIFDNYNGSDLAEKIRNFLIEKYSDWGLEYVLLVGDVNDVPMRICSPKANSTSENTPTDYYYADLTGDWDADNDGKFGEYGEDNPDWVPEVIVGRIPWSDAGTVENICEKLIAFEGEQGVWKKNGLLLGAMSNYANEDGKGWSKTDGAALMEIHKTLLENAGGNATTMYERAGIDSSSFPSDQGLTHNHAINEWSSGHYGIVNWWAHGSSGGAYRKYWASDDGDNVPESSAGEFNWSAIITTSDCNSLNDSYPAIIFANSCDNGYPERTSLGRTMIRRGSAGIVASSRLSWYTVGWQHQNHGGNASIDYFFFHYLIDQNDKVGDALFDSKVYYANHFMFQSWGWVCWQNLFDFNLYGDPALIWQGVQNQQQFYSISGGVYYQNGSLPIADAQVALSGGTTLSQKTTGAGTFAFSSLPGGLDYTVTVSKSGQLDETAILGFDASLAARIAMGIYANPTEEELLAADVDENGQVQLYDASLIAQFAVGIPIGGGSHVSDWVFKPSSRNFQQLSGNFADQNFTAVLIGDVDGNWEPGYFMAKVNNSKEIYPYLEDMKVAAGEEFIVPLKLAGIEEVFSFDAVIHFDNKLFQLKAVNSKIQSDQLQLFKNDNGKGVLRLTGFSPVELNGEDQAIELVFQAAEQPGASGNISVESFRLNNSIEMSAEANIRIIAKKKPLPTVFALKQNYPNPFNPTTTIAFDLPQQAKVKLVIYNALGQKIRTLLDKESPAGSHQISWDGKNEIGEKVSSGIYFYEIRAGNFRQVRKMSLLR
ncbi:MAG: T9SS type A sorting domain-containing protein [Calditrichaeota bacterium]|nr:T9SS type A sorting domain-containing protein [Calditrichota bacterium]